MPTKASTSGQKKSPKKNPRVIGRSAKSGKFILRPATSRGATITIKEANTAIKSASVKSTTVKKASTTKKSTKKAAVKTVRSKKKKK